MTLPFEQLEKIFSSVREAMDVQDGAVVRGINMEGPFLDPMKKGAHVEEYIPRPDPDFFRENKTGTLITPDETYDLEIFACLLTEASDKEIFEPTDWHSNNLHSFEPYIQENALSLRQDVLDALLEQENPHILVLSTCSSEFTDARTIVLATMTPHRLGAEEEA